MLKNKFLLLLGALFLFIIPLSTNAYYNESNYNYRSTVTGTGVKNSHSHVYQIVNQKSNFSQNESVHVLTRIFNITHINTFQFKHVLSDRDGGENSTLLSPVYRPNYNWWAETYSWNNFGKLNPATYEIKVYIRINNGSYEYLDKKMFTVDGHYDGCYFSNCGNYQNYSYKPYYNYQNYKHNWTYTGTGIKSYGYYKYSITGKTTEFKKNDNINIITKLSEIKGIFKFRVKHEIYKTNNILYKIKEGSIMRPYNDDWSYNYTKHDFGKIPQGKYAVKTYLKIENKTYRLINTEYITVGKIIKKNGQYRYDGTKSSDRIYNYSDTNNNRRYDNNKNHYPPYNNTSVRYASPNYHNYHQLYVKNYY